MSLEQQALYLAALGLLLRFNLVERELQGVAGSQPGLQQSEFDGRWGGAAGGGRTLRLKDRECAWIARQECCRRKWCCSIGC